MKRKRCGGCCEGMIMKGKQAENLRKRNTRMRYTWGGDEKVM